jgi:anion transporter
MHKIDFDSIPFFRELNRVDRARLIPRFVPMSYRSGNYLVRQGEEGNSFFIILKGVARIEVRRPGEDAVEVARLSDGDCFGEVCLLTRKTRTADVVAHTDMQLLRLSREVFQDLLQKHHSLGTRMAEALALRIQSTNDLFRKEPSPLIEPSPAADHMDDKEESLPSSKGLIAGWSLHKPLRDRRIASLLFAAITCSGAYFLLRGGNLTIDQILLLELLLAATIVWSFDAYSYHAVALVLPLAAVILVGAAPETAFSGFANPSWFLVLGVFALSAAVTRTGLMYRLVLILIRFFPPSYIGQSFALATAGLLLTPVIPSSNGRAVLIGPVVTNLSEIFGFRNGSAGSIGISMAALLGFGHMSFMFMNGTATCLLAFGLLPHEVTARVTWGDWLLAALPLGLTFFLLSYAATIYLYRPLLERTRKESVIKAQLEALGPFAKGEIVTLLTVLASLAAFLTQPVHHVQGAWIALLGFFVLFSSGVLTEKQVRSDIDWNFLISFGAIVGFGSAISHSGLGEELSRNLSPFLATGSENPAVFLVTVSLAVHLLRFALPLPAAQVVSILSVLPLLPQLGIDPFVLCLVVLISGNPWFFPFQSSLYLNLMEATEGRLFNHRQTRAAAVAHVLIVQAAIFVSVPYWQYLGLIRS